LPIIERLHLGITYIALLSAMATLLAFYGYFIFIFRSLSRRFERQSDLYAVESTGKPEVFKNALIKLTAVNYMPRRAPRLIELFRTHPSVSRRLEFVDRAVWGDADALKYRQPVFHIGRMTVLVALALSVLSIVNRDALFPPGDVHYEKGRQYAIEGMIDEAITEFRSAVRVDPEHEHAHYALGILYIKKGAMQKAIREMERTLEINPRNAGARESLKRIQAAGNERRMSL
jgi:tetratricopeptide (TPR) repeat protein